MYYFSVRHIIRKANFHINIFLMLLFQICLGSSAAYANYYGRRISTPSTTIPEEDKLIQISNIRSQIQCLSQCVTYSKCAMIIYSVSDKVCILRKIKQLPTASPFIDILANSIYIILQACELFSILVYVLCIF